MISEIVKIQAYISVDLLEELIRYRTTHNVNSVSQTVVVILCHFFDVPIPCLPLSLLDGQVREEKAYSYCIELLTCRHSKEATTVQEGNTEVEELNPNQYPWQVDKSKNQETSVCHPKSENDVGFDSASLKGQNLQKTDSEDSTRINTQLSSTEILVAELTSGLSSAMLVKRLRTNPTTLRKYLRDLKQVEWAVQRDPDGLGWIYDPLLQRYYPTQGNSDKRISHLATDPISTQGIKATPIVVPPTDTSGPNQSLQCDKNLDHSKGLRQVDLARLTGIPTNTLQRWKQSPNCAERIEERTRGCFAYRFSKQENLFYLCISRK